MRHGRKRGTDLLQSCVHSIREYQNFPNSYLLFTKVSMHLSINHSLCSAVHNYDSLCRRSSRSPIMLSILLVIGRAGASPPSRTAAIIFLYIYIFIYIYLYPCRTSCPKSSTRFFFSDISIFPNLYAMDSSAHRYSIPSDRGLLLNRQRREIEARLQQVRSAQDRIIATESAEEREACLQQVRSAQDRRIATESAEEREARLQQLRVAATEGIC